MNKGLAVCYLLFFCSRKYERRIGPQRCLAQCVVRLSMLSGSVCCQAQYVVRLSMLSGPVCCQAQYVVRPSVLSGPVCCQAQYVVRLSMLSGPAHYAVWVSTFEYFHNVKDIHKTWNKFHGVGMAQSMQ
jgi:hypothetical protein